MPQSVLVLEPGRYRRALYYERNAKLVERYIYEIQAVGSEANLISRERIQLPRCLGLNSSFTSILGENIAVRSTCLPMSGQLTAWRTREANRLHRDANFRVLPHYLFPSLHAHVVRRAPPCDWPHEVPVGPTLILLCKEQ